MTRYKVISFNDMQNIIVLRTVTNW